jgi:predicted metal-dependent hydrolase
MSDGSSPLILLLTQDLLFGTRVQDTLRGHGYRCQLIESPDQLAAEGSLEERPIPLTEPLHGADAGFMRSLARLQPALVLMDMSAQQLPWQRWIQIMKTSSASRRIPILAFGPHVDETSFRQAERAGANRVVPRGLLAKKLESLVQENLRLIDGALLARACQQPLSELARKGIELHNAGDYFEAHELLEEAWLAESGETGFLYRALLQITVAHLHLERGNQRGASKMLLRMRQWLDPLPDQCQGVRVDELRRRMDRLRQALLSLPADSLDLLDSDLLGPIPLVESAG